MKSDRHSRAKRQRPLMQRFADLRRSLDHGLQAYLRQRRKRVQRRRNNPVGEQQLLALRRRLQFRWIQRWLNRRQYNQQASWNPAAWFWPATGTALNSREAAGLLLRNAAAALVLLILISLVLNAIPLQLGSPNWYLRVLSYIAENVPVLLLASGFALLSLALQTRDENSSAYHFKLLRFSRLGYILVLLLLPLQLGLTAWLYGQAYSANRTQRNAILSNADALITGAQQTSTIDQFIAYLRSRNLTANLASIAAAPLVQVKTEFIRTVKVNQQQDEQRLGAETRTTLLRYTRDSVKLFVTLLVLAGFMRAFQTLVKRCILVVPTTEMPSLQTGTSVSLSD